MPAGHKALPLGLELRDVQGEYLPARAQPAGELLHVGPGRRERQRDTERVGRRLCAPDRLLGQHPELHCALARDRVHGAGGAAPDLFGADCLDQALRLHGAQLPVQGPDAHTAPLADVGHLGDAADLVAVPRAVLAERAEHHEPR
jgi:hypothetical protein